VNKLCSYSYKFYLFLERVTYQDFGPHAPAEYIMRHMVQIPSLRTPAVDILLTVVNVGNNNINSTNNNSRDR